MELYYVLDILAEQQPFPDLKMLGLTANVLMLEKEFMDGLCKFFDGLSRKDGKFMLRIDMQCLDNDSKIFLRDFFKDTLDEVVKIMEKYWRQFIFEVNLPWQADNELIEEVLNESLMSNYIIHDQNGKHIKIDNEVNAFIVSKLNDVDMTDIMNLNEHVPRFSFSEGHTSCPGNRIFRIFL